jgi:protein-S-isoprenylcysteine O-methyltransferase Ste14
VLGILLRTWAAGTIHKTKKLATTGPYALARHPLYLGSFLIAMGFSLFLWDNENMWAVIAVGVLLYLPKIRREEIHLAQLFGNEWPDYCRRTAMFFPKSLPKLRSDWSFQQWNHNHEYETFAAGLIALTIIRISQQMFGN